MYTTSAQRLREEMLRRMNDGWHLDGEMGSAEMRMLHLVTPPAWRVALELVNPVAWFLGPTYPTVYRNACPGGRSRPAASPHNREDPERLAAGPRVGSSRRPGSTPGKSPDASK
ncbi:hypothetical protein [Leifsonia sp. 1010]|uniref:hypothetical protein n=1 Tax=Leifsonia sp. 1010 TaxID=2817769 RepID=UPI0028547372|nr:hypothetical protein [Leifsonia sp. 1010]MDR6612927.1 hypothetical protein [Leifsonia sp. 1010]